MGRSSGAQLLEQLPLDLTCECLAFLAVEDLLLDVAPASRLMAQLASALVGAAPVDGPVTSPRTRRGLVAFPPLEARYSLLRDLRAEFDDLEDAAADPSSPMGDPVRRAATFNDLADHLCKKRVKSCFEKLVAKDDTVLLDHFALHAVDAKTRPVTFRTMVKLHDFSQILVRERQEYLLKFFEFATDEEEGLRAVRSSRVYLRPLSVTLHRKGHLTDFGKQTCDRIFDHFDAHNRNALGFEELARINEAACLPLSQSAFAWVQQTYETNDDGLLTREGYHDMFLHNFIRVPRLMHKDLNALLKFVEREEAIAAQAEADAEAAAANKGARAARAESDASVAGAASPLSGDSGGEDTDSQDESSSDRPESMRITSPRRSRAQSLTATLVAAAIQVADADGNTSDSDRPRARRRVGSVDGMSAQFNNAMAVE